MSSEQPSPNVESMRQIFAEQRKAFELDRYPSYQTRQTNLLKLKSLILDNAEAISAAVSADFGSRSPYETKLLDIFGFVTEINHSLKYLKKWMKPRRKGVSIWFQPGKAVLQAQPLGVIGIAAPWNYPLYLTLGPLAGALTAGNRAMIKIASDSSNFGTLIGQLLAKEFPQDLVAVIQPGPGINDHFSRMPFDHFIFTGSPSVGKQVMKNCSENLTPVTLELGGKSPTVVAPDYSIKTAAETIIWGKCVNSGQTCVAPDYVFIPEGSSKDFVEVARATVARNYPGKLSSNSDYTSMINQRQLNRVNGLLEDAREKGAEIIALADPEDAISAGKLAPHLVLNVTEDMQIMKEEIFGPLLPVMTYRGLDEVLGYINAHERPLAFYYFDDDRNRTDMMLKKTISGGASINTVMLHVLQENLPFGGVGNSGIGHYHAEEGFQTFSKMRPVFYQSKINGSALLKPPYGKITNLLLKLTLR